MGRVIGWLKWDHLFPQNTVFLERKEVQPPNTFFLAMLALS